MTKKEKRLAAMTKEEKLLEAMRVAGYNYDSIESTKDYLRFFGETHIFTFAGFSELEEWLDEVVFDPNVTIQIEEILHPERVLPFA